MEGKIVRGIICCMTTSILILIKYEIFSKSNIKIQNYLLLM